MSFSAIGIIGPNRGNIDMYLYKNGLEIPESVWDFGENSGSLNDNISVAGSRIVVSNISDCFFNFGGFPEYLTF